MTTVNIASHLKDMARRSPEQLAVLFPTSRGRSGQTEYASYTYQRLDEESDHVAAGLDSIGIGRGVKTVLMVPPSLEFFSLTFALFKAGAVPVLVDPGMGIKNLGKCLAEAEPEAFIGITKAQLARVLFGWGKRSINKVVTVGRRLGWRGPNLDQVIKLGRNRQSEVNRPGNQVSSPTPAPLAPALRGEGRGEGISTAQSLTPPVVGHHPGDRWAAAETQSDETAAILFTSGSTGVPKGAVYSHGNFAAQVDALKESFGIEPGEIDLCTFPLFALFAPALGMTAVVPRMDFTKPARVNPTEIDAPIRRFQVNNLFGSPALLDRVGREFPLETGKTPNQSATEPQATKAWPSLRRVLSAGAPVSPIILERFLQRLPQGVQIFTPYGATESLPVAIIGSDEILRETRRLTDKGAGTCVGRPVETIAVEIISISDGPIAEWSPQLRLPPGEIGEIVVHGPMVTQQYFHRPDLTALAKIHDPASGRMRHRMGDVGYFDTQGRLWFCGRKSHRVITADRTLFTEPVEGVFNTHPAVFRTALVGVPRDGRIEPVLCVERERNDRARMCSSSARSSLAGRGVRGEGIALPSSTNTHGQALPSAEDFRTISDAVLTKELLEIGEKFEHTRCIQTVLFHHSFPVDIRHNSKIFREKLAIWAAAKLRFK